MNLNAASAAPRSQRRWFRILDGTCKRLDGYSFARFEQNLKVNQSWVLALKSIQSRTLDWKTWRL